MKEMLLKAPDGQLDAAMHPLIAKWDENPTSLQILEVLDHCIHGALASGFVVTVLQSLYDSALLKEGKIHADNEPLATWRNHV